MLSAQPKAPTSLPKIKYPIDIKGLEDWKEQYIKRDQALELTSTNVPLESNPFREACLNSSISEAKKWSAMYSVNSRGINVNEETLLMECISQSRPFQAIKMLVDLGAFLHVVDRRGRTALHHACETENLAVIELLMRKKAPWFTRDSSGRTPIHIAAGSSSPNCLEMILKYTKNTDEINQGDDELMSPLHWAAAKNNIAHFDIILKKKYGFDLGRTDIEGKTALHWTAPHPVELGKGSSNSCAFKIVKARPAIINNRDMEGRTILHLACGENNLGLVHLIASHPQCDLNAQDDMKRTALHWASVAGYSNIVSVLLKFGADDSVSDEVGATPLHYAASKNHLQSVITLIEGRSYAYLMDLEGRTPIVWAIMKGHLQALRTLLDKGVDIDSRDYTGCTALHAAAASGNTMCASLLIQKGCQIDSLDSNLRSPLFKAIEKGFAEPAALLLQRGAKSALVDQDGRTPLHFGAMYGHLNVLSLLLANECDPNTKDKTGKAPLHCAAYV